MEKFKGKTALITGASRGIGKAIALEFARHGMARLLLVARTRHCLESIKGEIHRLAPGVEVIPIPLDLTRTAQVKQRIPQALSNYGPIHILVNNAGVAHQVNFLNSTLETFEDEINVNLRGNFAITRLVAQHMVKQQAGTIVNVSSLMGKLAAPTYSTYSATKFALLGLTQSLRMELARHHIRVVALLPTLTDTDMVKGTNRFALVVPSSPEAVAKALVRGLRQGKYEILVGWQSKVAVLASYIAPWLIEAAMTLSEKLGRQNMPQQRSNPIFQDCCSVVPDSTHILN